MLAVRARRIETYSFSTRCRSFCKRAGNGFDSSRNLLPAGCFAHTLCFKRKSPLKGFFGNICVRARRIELPSTGWKPVILPLNYARK